MLGIYSGAVTNTPSLGAGSQTLSTLPNIAPDRLALPALGYAVTYPMAIVGIIGTLIFLKQIFRIDPAREAAEFAEKNRAQSSRSSGARSWLRIQTWKACGSTRSLDGSRQA